VFDVAYHPDPLIALYGIGGGTLAVALAGRLGTRSTLSQPPLAILRQVG